MAKSIMQTAKECYITGSRTDLHKHHVFQGIRRKASEEWGCWIWLRSDWHDMSDRGIHFNKELDLQVKQETQQRFEQMYGHDTFLKVFGKSYL